MRVVGQVPEYRGSVRTALLLSVPPLTVLTGLLVVVLARRGLPLGLDLTVRQALTGEGAGARHTIALVVTQLGAGPVLYPLLGALCVPRLRTRAGRPVWWALLPVLALAAGQVLEGVLFVTLPRPALFDGGGSSSFSSGHAAAATLAWGLVCHSAMGWRHDRDRPRACPQRAVCRERRAGAGSQGRRPKPISDISVGSPAPRGGCWRVVQQGMTSRTGPRELTAGHVSVVLPLATAAGLGVGASRVHLGVHWATDVLAAVAFGLLLLIATVTMDIRIGRDTPPQLEHGGTRTEPRWSSPWLWLIPMAAAAISVVSLLLTPGAQRLKDLLVYQGAGGAAGAGSDVYGFRTTFDMPFTYPPFAALLSEPLSRVPVGLGQVLWTGATLVALVALARSALAPVVVRFGLPLTVAALLLSSPVRSHLRFGQVNVFLILVVALDLLRTSGPAGRRGLGLGVAIAVKLTPAVFLPWLFVTRSWRRLRATLYWLCGASLLGMLLLWRSAVDYLWSASNDTTRFGANDIPGNQSVRGMLLRSHLPDGLATACWITAAVLLVVVGTHGAWRLERAGQRLAAVGVLASLSVAVSPISWVHHLVWLVLPIAALATAGRWRLALAWYLLLIPGLPALGTAGTRSGEGPEVLWHLVTNLQGLTAVAAVVLLPVLCLPAHRAGETHLSDASEVSRRSPRHGPHTGTALGETRTASVGGSIGSAFQSEVARSPQSRSQRR